MLSLGAPRSRQFRGLLALLVVLVVAAPLSAVALAAHAPRHAVHHRVTHRHGVAHRHGGKSHRHGKGANVPADTSTQPQVLAQPDQYATLNNQVLSVSSAQGVLATDSDRSSWPLAVDRVNANSGTPPLQTTSADGATVTINADGSFTYDPRSATDLTTLLNGQVTYDWFTYRVTDGHGGTATASVLIVVVGTFVPPALSNIEAAPLSYYAGTQAANVTSGLTVTAPSDATLAGATVAITNGFVQGQDQLAFTSEDGVSGSFNSTTGVLALSGTATVADYQAVLRTVTFAAPDGTAVGDRTVAFVVDDGRASNNLSNVASRTVSVLANQPPTAGNVSVTTDYQTALDIDVLSHAGDPDGDTLSVVSVDTTGTTGSVTINANGTVDYDPSGKFDTLPPGQTATDTFTYTVSDGYSNSNQGTVDVTVTRPPAPVLANLETAALSYRAQDPPVAVTSALTITDSGSTTINAATVTISSGFASAEDTLDFTNQNGISGSYDSVTGVLRLSGDASLAAYQAALQSVAFYSSDGSAAPATRTVTFEVTDATGASSGSVSRQIDVARAGQPPVAADQSYSAVGNTPLGVGTTPKAPAASVSGSLLQGDSDPNAGGTLSVTANTTPAHGSVSVNSDGTFTYTPATGFSGSDSFQYTITDSATSKSATGTVTINVGPVVWYVDNSQAVAGSGGADSPFNTLAAANGAAGANSIVFLYKGSGEYSGGVTMQPGEDLYGQPHGLTVDKYALVAAGGTNPTITNAGGDGIDLASGADVEAVDVSQPSGNGIAGTGIAAATVGGSDPVVVSGAGADGIDISGGNGTLDLSDTSVSGSSGHSVEISGRTGGTTTIGGSISDSGSGIALSDNSGATIDFGGKLTVSTGANSAFAATGGGTVEATATGSTLATTTGTALDVANTTIGASGLTFQSISAGTPTSGPARGIELIGTGTSGGLSVTGDGSTAAGGDGSGGTIQHTSSTGSETLSASDGGIYLDSAASVSLADMEIGYNHANGVYGASVNGLTLSSDAFTSNGSNANADDAGLRIDGLTGSSAITNTSISGSASDNARIYGGGAGTNLTLNVTGSTFSGPHTPGSGLDSPVCKLASSDQGDGLLVEPEDGDVTVTATGDEFSGNYSEGLAVTGSGDASDTGNIAVDAEHNVVTDNCDAGIVVGDSAAGTTTGQFTIDSNSITNEQGDGIVANNFGGGLWTGHIDSNTIGNASDTDSGSLAGDGIDVTAEDADYVSPDTRGTMKVDVSNNTIRQIETGFGINANANDGPSILDLTLTGNTIKTDQPDSQDGITVQAGASPSDTSTVCLNATDNTSESAGTGVYGYGDQVGMSVGEFDASTGATFDVQGPTTADVTGVEAYLDANNTLSGTTANDVADEAFAQFDGMSGIASCPTAP